MEDGSFAPYRLRSRERILARAAGLALGLAVAGACGASCVVARAQDHPASALDQAVQRYEAADFEGALSTLAEAEAAGLTRSDFLRMLATRALVHFALGQSEATEHDLAILASLDPSYALGERAPPALQHVYDREKSRIQGTLGLDLAFRLTGSGVHIAAHTNHDAGGVVQQVRVAVQVGGEPWHTGQGGTLDVVAPPGAVVRYYAVALGPGGVELARSGSRADPLTRRTPPASGHSHQASGGAPAWPWLLAGGGLLVAGAVVAIVLLSTQGPSGSQLGPPVVRWTPSGM